MTSPTQAGDLACFAALASAGSLSAAAGELGITTPAVSKHPALMRCAAPAYRANMGQKPKGSAPCES
jgi:DNA-binding transcriptional regulator YdaS (Cro superfamily)